MSSPRRISPESPPARRAGSTRMYLSGKAAGRVKQYFTGGFLDVRLLDEEPGSASALKMVYAAYTKGEAALLAAIQAVARREGVMGALASEWQISQPELSERAPASARSVASRAWRFAGEMDEIAATFRGAGLPGGFHEAAAEVYRRLAEFKDVDPAPSTEAIVRTLLRSP